RSRASPSNVSSSGSTRSGRPRSARSARQVSRSKTSRTERYGSRVRQAVPPSITGKGAGFEGGGSVLDHRFGAAEPFTLGVEEEYMLLGEQTLDLMQHIEAVLAAVEVHECEEWLI